MATNDNKMVVLKELLARDRPLLEVLGNEILDDKEAGDFEVGDKVSFMLEDTLARKVSKMRRVDGYIATFYENEDEDVLALVYPELGLGLDSIYYGVPPKQLKYNR